MDGVSLRPDNLIESIRAGWHWWLQELGQMVPQSVRDAVTMNDAVVVDARPADFLLVRRRGQTEGTIARIPCDALAGRALRLSIPRTGRRWRDDPVILQLPQSDALDRTLRLPRTARRDLDNILRHEVVRQSPIDAQDIYYDYRVAPSSAGNGMLEIGLRIARRDSVDPLLQLFREAGIPIAAVEFSGDLAHADGATFPADPTAARDLKLRPRIVPALVALVAVCALLFVGALYLRGAWTQADLEARVDDARSRAVMVTTLQRRLDAAHRQAIFLAGQKNNPAAAAVLAEVSRTLPSDSWLSEFELNGNEVRIHGTSGSAASLIALFDSSRYFTSAQFRSPLNQGMSSGLQVFDMSFRVRPQS